MSVAAVSDTLALAFGGIDSDGSASGYLGAFKPQSGWSKGKLSPASDGSVLRDEQVSDFHAALASGNHPQARSGHSAVYDNAAYQMVISFGIGVGPMLLGDLWAFDLDQYSWTCLQGSQPGCKAPASIGGPGARAHAASVRVGTKAYYFGGIRGNSQVCPDLQGKREIFSTINDMWQLDLISYKWTPVQSATAPDKRAFGNMAYAGHVGSLVDAVVMIGGAQVDCRTETPPCAVPQPMKDIWFIDVAMQVWGDGMLISRNELHR